MPSTTFTKRPHQMTTAELKAAADKEGLAYYRQQMDSDPNNPQARYEYENYCRQVGVQPDKELNRLHSLSRAQLAQEWTTKGRAIEDQNSDAWRAANAVTFIASQPAFTPTPANAAKMVAEMESRGLRGSVMDLQVCFDHLVKHGDIQVVQQLPAPVKLLSEDEMRAMPLSELKDYIDDAGRKGIL